MNQSTPTAWASVVKNTRAARHLSQREAADELQVSLRSLQGWEAGRMPQPRHRRAILSWATRDLEVAA